MITFSQPLHYSVLFITPLGTFYTFWYIKDPLPVAMGWAHGLGPCFCEIVSG